MADVHALVGDERPGPLEAHLGARPQVDDEAHAVAVDEAGDVRAGEPLEVVGAQQHARDRHAAAGDGQAAEVADVHRAVELHPVPSGRDRRHAPEGTAATARRQHPTDPTQRQPGARTLVPRRVPARTSRHTFPIRRLLPMKRMLIVLGLAAVAALPIAAPAAASPASAQSDKTIVEVAASNPQFSTLVGLVQKAGLAETLSSGTFTVFAPTNAAFDKVPKKTLDALAADPDQLRAVLTYHVAEGRLTAGKVVRRTKIKTVNGASVRVSVRGKRVFLNRNSRVTKTNIRASNGVLHVINRVLLPPS
jgi:uncharacterized surface protein with fasciclin (FAS1) repeats